MTPAGMLLARVEGLERELGLVGRALDRGELGARLQARLEPRLRRELAAQRKALGRVRKAVTEERAAELCWEMHRKAQARCRSFFAEWITCVQGAAMRAAGTDGGMCTVADALLDELASRGDGIGWGGFTVPAAGERFSDTADVIRLRFPEAGVWNLPVAAHEFGHYVGPVLKERDAEGRFVHPFDELLRRESLGDGWIVEGTGATPARIQQFVHEYFADAFAAWTLGPAYACTCVFLRFDPGTPTGSAHPSDAARAYAVLRTLEGLGGPGAGFDDPFPGVAAYLRDAWAKAAGAAGAAGDWHPPPRLDGLLDEMVALLRAALPLLRYDAAAWNRAQALSPALAPAEPDPDPPQGAALVDVLNAAWRARLAHPGDEAAGREVARKAMAVLTGLATRG
jgi:hypothetical protein